MTLGEAIRAAHCESLQAEQRRNDLLARARERGVSTRALASLLGVGATTAWRWSGGTEIESLHNRNSGRILLEIQEIAPASVVADRGLGTEPQGGPAHGGT